jgi:hypothetical protein
MDKLPESYEEVFIWVGGQRKIARLNAAKTHWQLATFLADTKAQYLVGVDDIEHWRSLG